MKWRPVFLICEDCHAVYVGDQHSLYCHHCRHKPRPERRCHPIAPELWDPLAVAHFHPGGTLADVWDQINCEVAP